MSTGRLTRNGRIGHGLLLASVVAALSACGAFSTAPATPIVLPARVPPTVQQWNAQVSTVCLVTKLDFPTPGQQSGTVDVVRAVMAGVGVDVLAPGAACDAVMTMDVAGTPLAGDYVGGTYYTGADITGTVSLEAADRQPLTLPIDVHHAPPSEFSYAPANPPPTDPEQYDFDGLWMDQVLGFLVQTWGRRSYVWVMGGDNLAYVTSAEKVQAIGPQEDIITELAYAIRDGNPALRGRAIIVMGELSPAPAPAVPLFVEALGDPDAGVRGWAAYALGKLGGGAEPAVPALKTALERETDPSARSDIHDALRSITGEDVK